MKKLHVTFISIALLKRIFWETGHLQCICGMTEINKWGISFTFQYKALQDKKSELVI